MKKFILMFLVLFSTTTFAYTELPVTIQSEDFQLSAAEEGNGHGLKAVVDGCVDAACQKLHGRIINYGPQLGASTNIYVFLPEHHSCNLFWGAEKGKVVFDAAKSYCSSAQYKILTPTCDEVGGSCVIGISKK